MHYFMYLIFPYLQFVALLLIITYLVYSIYSTYKQKKRHDKVIDELSQNMVEQVAEYMLSKADDERPIMLTVNAKAVAKEVEEEVIKNMNTRRWGA